MLTCDVCSKDFDNDCVLKQPCCHRIHKKCDSDQDQCMACKKNKELEVFGSYLALLIIGVVLGLLLATQCWKTTDTHATIRQIESNLVKMGKASERSGFALMVVKKSLDRIMAIVDQETARVMSSC